MSALCQKQTFRLSLDYLVGTGKQRGRYGDAEQPRGGSSRRDILQ